MPSLMCLCSVRRIRALAKFKANVQEDPSQDCLGVFAIFTAASRVKEHDDEDVDSDIAAVRESNEE
eukprot:IDg10322t1